MKKIALFFVVFAVSASVSAQEKPATKTSDIVNRAGDHIVLQLGSDIWMNAPDSITSHKKGLARSANVYVMMDKPLKSDNRYSFAFGLGVGTSNMYFKRYKTDIASTSTKLPFTNLDSANHFKKYKLTTAYLEVPVELRFTNDIKNPKKSLKAAIGVKVGTLLNAHTKGKTLQSKTGSVVNNYIEKQSDKHFFNSTRLAVTARVGFANYSLFASYQINGLLKDGAGPQIKPLQVGISLSGL
jgi:Outer membrane protein beta-barrel domain